jgi:hypothetical protein
MATQSSDWGEVVDKVLMGPYDTPVVMHKVRDAVRFSWLAARTHARTHACSARMQCTLCFSFDLGVWAACAILGRSWLRLDSSGGVDQCLESHPCSLPSLSSLPSPSPPHPPRTRTSHAPSSCCAAACARTAHGQAHLLGGGPVVYGGP